MRARRFTLLLPALAAAALLASAAPASAAVKYTCKDKKASFLFWPQGHGASETGQFPEFRTPHLELYGGIHSTTFPTDTRVYMDSGGTAQVNKACGSGQADAPQNKIANSAKKKKAANVQCRFGKKMTLMFFAINGGVKLDVLRAGKLVVEVKMKPSGSSIAFNKKFCGAKAPPKTT